MLRCLLLTVVSVTAILKSNTVRKWSEWTSIDNPDPQQKNADYPPGARGQYTWCDTAAATSFVCTRNVRIIPFEGMVGIVQVGLLWKEQSFKASNQIKFTTENAAWESTRVVFKLRRMWTVASSANEQTSIYNIKNPNNKGTDQADDSSRQFIFSNKYAQTNADNNYVYNSVASSTGGRGGTEYMAGDIVPFRSCAYIVNLNTDGTQDPAKKYYAITRLRLDLMYDGVNKKKENRIYVDHEVVKEETGRASNTDFNRNGEAINFWPGWGGFYFVSRGQLHIIWDKTFDMDAYYTGTDIDPCARDTKLFPTSAAFKYSSYNIQPPDIETYLTTAERDTMYLQAHDFTNTWFWGILYSAQLGSGAPDANRGVTKASLPTGGNPLNTAGQGTFELFYITGRPDQTMGGKIERGAYSYDPQTRLNVYTNDADCPKKKWHQIDRIAGMDKYGVALSVNHKGNTDSNAIGCYIVFQYKPCYEYTDLTKPTDVSIKELKRDTLSRQYVLEPSGCGSSSRSGFLEVVEVGFPTFPYVKLVQYQGEMHTHRPAFATAWGVPGAMIRVTSDVNLLFNFDKNAATGIENWNKPGDGDYCTHNVDFFNADDIMLRFHYVAVNPGSPGDTHATLKKCCVSSNCATTCCDTNYDWIDTKAEMTVHIGNMRTKKIEHSIPLQHCGDGTVDSTYFEDCEINQISPNGLVKNLATADNTYGSQGQTAADSSLTGGVNTVAWFTNANPTKYQQCNETCQKTDIDLCGDGYQSNAGGDAAFTGTVELCDEGIYNQEFLANGVTAVNNKQTNGCGTISESHSLDSDTWYVQSPPKILDCTKITDGWECLIWGTSCRKQCGNGKVNDATVDNTQGDNKLKTEQCDMGDFNGPETGAVAGTTHWYPCTYDCQWNKYYDKDIVLTQIEIWTCVNNRDSGTGIYTSDCTLTLGDGILDYDKGEKCEHKYQPYRKFTPKGPADLTGKVIGESGVVENTTPTEYIDGCIDSSVLTSTSVLTTMPPTADGRQTALHRVMDTIFSQHKPEENDVMTLGCTFTASTIDQIEPNGNWVFPITQGQTGSGIPNGLKGIDTCGDWIYDGIYEEVERFKPRRMVWNLAQEPHNVGGDAKNIDANMRKAKEQCDNGHYPDKVHGCDRMCQVMTDWTCRHFYKRLDPYEVPVYGSRCQQTASATWRRLEGESDYDFHMRKLFHTPVPTYFQRLPTNNYYYEKHSLALQQTTCYPVASSTDKCNNIGLNGKLMLIEHDSNTALYGFVYGYQPQVATTTNYYTKVWVKYMATTVTSSWATYVQAVAQSGYTFGAYQRATMGQYMIMSKDEYSLEFWGYTDTSATDVTFNKLYTTTKDSNQQILGSHEFYWWPQMNFLLVRLGDGSSFRVWRFATNFETVVAAGEGTQKFAERISQPAVKLFQVPGKISIAPVFHGKYAIFFTSDNNIGNLHFYTWCTQNATIAHYKSTTGLVPSQVSTAGDPLPPHSLVKLAGTDGILFKAHGTTVINRYVLSPWSTDTTTTFVDPGVSKTGTFSLANFYMTQVKEDPVKDSAYSTATAPAIWGFHNSGYVYKMAWAANVLTITADADIVTMPTKMSITLKPEWIDFGLTKLVVFSPMNCATFGDATVTTTVTTSGISNPSVNFYTFGTYVAPVDADANNLDDNTGLALDYNQGWFCVDVPATEAASTTKAWDIT